MIVEAILGNFSLLHILCSNKRIISDYPHHKSSWFTIHKESVSAAAYHNTRPSSYSNVFNVDFRYMFKCPQLKDCFG
jgi:hypothetical protein